METGVHCSESISSSSGSSKTTPCSYSSNWTIVHGSFDKSLTFETSDSPIDDSDVADSTRKSPLVLKPLSPDSGPCEIKLSFSQKHEIRQVYVRSTARIYEIYYAPALQSSNEYLCSVRCSIVAKGDELLREHDIEEAVPSHKKGSDGESSEKKSNSENGIGTNEDDWVEVNPDSPPLDNRNVSLPRDTAANGRSPQDFYEATAEISDADHCISLVLRLLSLENKACVYVDEVYVYADPIELSDLENQAVQRLQAGNSAGSSLMAMFVPTLLHMTRSGVGQSQDKRNSNMAKREQTDKGPRKADSTGYLNVIQRDEKSKLPDWKDVKLQEVRGVSAEASQFQIPAPVSDRERQYNSVASYDSHLGRVMEQLISRVSRIEDICLRFEENMVKPINSMEARLQQVEDQLEVIVKNTQYSGFPSSARFSAPAFSSLDSSSSSFHNDGSANPRVQSEMEKQDASIDDISKSDDNSKSVRAPKFLPSLVVTAPEFSCGEEDEENDVVVPPKDPPLEKPKQTLSIDDVLAAALAGFSSMTISEPLKPSESASKSTNEENGDGESLKYTENPTVKALESTNEESANDEPSKFIQSLKVTAPDFSSEDNVYDDKVVSPKIENENLLVSSDSFATNGDEHTPDSSSASSNTSFVVETQVANSVDFKETSEGGDGLDNFCEEQIDGNSLGITISFPSTRARDELKTDDCQAADESSNRASKVPILDRFEILRQLHNNQTEDSADTTKEGSGASSRDVERGSDKDLFVEVTKSSYASVLDFETPILEVKFASRENSGSDLPLEALLTDTQIEYETSLVQKSGGVITMEPNDLGSVQDEERKTMRTNNHLLMDLESYDAPVISEIAVGLQDPLASIKQEIFASLI